MSRAMEQEIAGGRDILNDMEIVMHGDPHDPQWRRGRELAREVVNASLFRVDAAGPPERFKAALTEAMTEGLVGEHWTVLISLVSELRLWAEVATRDAAECHGASIEDVVAAIQKGIDGATPN
jgi:hypothetical protein